MVSQVGHMKVFGGDGLDKKHRLDRSRIQDIVTWHEAVPKLTEAFARGPPAFKKAIMTLPCLKGDLTQKEIYCSLEFLNEGFNDVMSFGLGAQNGAKAFLNMEKLKDLKPLKAMLPRLETMMCDAFPSLSNQNSHITIGDIEPCLCAAMVYTRLISRLSIPPVAEDVAKLPTPPGFVAYSNGCPPPPPPALPDFPFSELLTIPAFPLQKDDLLAMWAGPDKKAVSRKRSGSVPNLEHQSAKQSTQTKSGPGNTVENKDALSAGSIGADSTGCAESIMMLASANQAPFIGKVGVTPKLQEMDNSELEKLAQSLGATKDDIDGAVKAAMIQLIGNLEVMRGSGTAKRRTCISASPQTPVGSTKVTLQRTHSRGAATVPAKMCGRDPEDDFSSLAPRSLAPELDQAPPEKKPRSRSKRGRRGQSCGSTYGRPSTATPKYSRSQTHSMVCPKCPGCYHCNSVRYCPNHAIKLHSASESSSEGAAKKGFHGGEKSQTEEMKEMKEAMNDKADQDIDMDHFMTGTESEPVTQSRLLTFVNSASSGSAGDSHADTNSM